MFRPYGSRILDVAGLGLPGEARIHAGTALPKSGTSGTFKNSKAGSLYFATTAGAFFVNEGTRGNPYWTPTNFNQRGLYGFYTDFRDGVGKALADTAATATVGGSGLRIHGSSIADTDAGLTIAQSTDGPVASLVTGNENPDAAVLSFGNDTTALFKPSTSDVLVMDVNVAQLTAITSRSFFAGFLGSAADAIAAPITGSGTTISFANTFSDEIHGICFTSALTDADGLFCVNDKANANASIATTATGVDPSLTKAAAGAYERFRVEVDADGGVRMFLNKVQIASFAAATAAPTTALHPVIVQNTLTTANATALLKHFACWGARP